MTGFRFPFFRIRFIMKTISKVRDHMKSLGLSILKSSDKCLYATLLDTKAVHAPRSLRGSRHDSVSGFKWKRKFEFILKHRYGIPVKHLVSALAEASQSMPSFSPSLMNYTIVSLKDRGGIKVRVTSKANCILDCTPVNF